MPRKHYWLHAKHSYVRTNSHAQKLWIDWGNGKIAYAQNWRLPKRKPLIHNGKAYR